MNVTFRQLRAFSHVARLGSFSHAAESLSLTSGALSHLIRDLEAEVGVRLFERTTRSVGLSKAGEIYLPHAERVLNELAAAALCAKDLREGKSGSVRIAATHLLAAIKLPSLMVAYQASFPETRLVLRDAKPDVLIELVASGEVDLALGPERPVPDTVISEEVFSDDLMLICGNQHRLAARASVAWDELANESFIVIGDGAAVRTMVDINFKVLIEPSMQVDQFTTGIALVAAGQGIMLSTAYVGPFLKEHALRLIPLVNPSVRRRIMLFRHAAKLPSPAADRFAGFLQARLAADQEPG
ncbi:MAG: LysR family transcriptional regulator [Ottowia sp.]|uniref:LysR family transcriptional regulator n=1 Tax=Ottowia sp. TaxID=1898956 RepID=UPI003C78CECF